MSLPGLPQWLRAAGLDVVETPGWAARARPGSFAPIGVMIHHTAGQLGKPAPSLNVVIDGRPDLPGPLCQVLIGRDGVCHVIAAGRGNHAGIGAWPGVASGNGQLVGIEVENNGIGEPWSRALLEVMARATAAVLDGIGAEVSVHFVIGHKEWAPGRKVDPAGVDMEEFRELVRVIRGKDPTMPTNLTEEWQRALLANGARLGDAGPGNDGIDGDFGRLTLAASQTILNHRNQLLGEVVDLRKAIATNADTIKRLTAERDALVANGRASELAAAIRTLLTDRGL